MALTLAHPTGRDRFAWGDLVEASATIESGTAIGIEYIASETKASRSTVEGHAAAGRLHAGRRVDQALDRMRGGSLGHHQALEKEERFSRFRSDEMARLVWALGAMAAGVLAARRTASAASRPRPERHGWSARRRWGRAGRDDATRRRERRERARERVLKRFESIRADHEPDERRWAIHRESGRAACSTIATPGAGGPDRRAAYVSAYNLVLQTGTRSSGSRTSSSCGARSSATSWSRSATGQS